MSFLLYGRRASGCGAGGLLADAEDDELRGLHRRDADEDDEPAVVDVGLGHRGLPHLDEERLLGRVPEERAVPPDAGEEVREAAADRGPQGGGVRLEDRELRAPLDRLLDEEEEPPDRDIDP